ncbi:hypothetical protein AGMMS49525_09690 [Bacteroidia bacterium]|nr:hypothetical protein AGMMS49525_09690 [Bacteroidia bacterium]
MKTIEQQPLISVIVPVWNVEKYVGECLESILGQTYRNLEIIVVNDGSPDNSVDVVKQYVAQDGRIKLIEQKNAGPSVARNAGLTAATGEFVHFMDSDDRLFFVDHYEKMLDAMTQNDADVAVCGLVDSRRPHVRRPHYKKVGVYTTIRQKIRESHVVKLPAVPRYVYRKILLDRHQMQFEPGVVCGEDVLFSIPVIYYAKKMVVVPDTFWWYRRTGNSITKSPERAQQRKKDRFHAWDSAVRFADAHHFSLGFRRGFLWKIRRWLFHSNTKK